MHFTERQGFPQPWLWAILLVTTLGSSGVVAYGMVQQLVYDKPFGDHPTSDVTLAWTGALTIGLNALLLWLFCRMVLEVRVEPDALYVRFPPFVRRKIPYAEIRSAEARTYSPLREYGGWGIRFGRNGKAYNVSGNQGVQLEMRTGERLLLGSQRAEDLAFAIRSRLPNAVS